jgi:hypothetical protein
VEFRVVTCSIKSLRLLRLVGQVETSQEVQRVLMVLDFLPGVPGGLVWMGQILRGPVRRVVLNMATKIILVRSFWGVLRVRWRAMVGLGRRGRITLGWVVGVVGVRVGLGVRVAIMAVAVVVGRLG